MVRVRLQCSNSAVFAGNGIDIMHTHDHDDNSSLFMSSASLSWQRLQLVLCHTNNFYGKVLSVDGQLLTSNIIDTVRFFEELWDIIGVSVFLRHGVLLAIFAFRIETSHYNEWDGNSVWMQMPGTAYAVAGEWSMLTGDSSGSWDPLAVQWAGQQRIIKSSEKPLQNSCDLVHVKLIDAQTHRARTYKHHINTHQHTTTTSVALRSQLDYGGLRCFMVPPSQTHFLIYWLNGV